MTSCLRCACVCIAHDVSSSRKIVNQPYARAHAGGREAAATPHPTSPGFCSHTSEMDGRKGSTRGVEREMKTERL